MRYKIVEDYEYFESEPLTHIKRIKSGTIYHYTSIEALKNILEKKNFG